MKNTQETVAQPHNVMTSDRILVNNIHVLREIITMSCDYEINASSILLYLASCVCAVIGLCATREQGGLTCTSTQKDIKVILPTILRHLTGSRYTFSGRI